ncbi:MAG TPA: FAD-dependent oxidoreductase [Armatimonadota bacterium]|nr:FAD-dependent oxidoreductase [Armatimonadota bacterium]
MQEERIARTITRPAREVPVMIETDVLVCGGGPAGTAAAVAAARQGASVALIERYNHLGGLATGGLVLVLPHFVDHGRQVIGGFGLETRSALLEHGRAGMRKHGDDTSAFDPEALKWLSIRQCRDAGVEVLHHCWLADVVLREERVAGVIFESKSGSGAALAKVVVDATGDGDIFAWAGAEFEHSNQGIGLPFRLAGIDVPRWQADRAERHQWHVDFWKRLREEIGWSSPFYIEHLPPQPDMAWGNNMHSVADGLDVRALSQIDMDARLKIHQAVERIRAELPGFENVWLVETASQTGVRRTRRLAGTFRLTAAEVSQFDYRHEEAIGRGNDHRRRGPVYDIPYGCLVPKSLDGLLACGRCVSTDDEALEAMREIHVCWVTGEAAGVAAALAAKRGCQPREVPIGVLQQVLRESNVAFAD